jgi:hypothetical protein
MSVEEAFEAYMQSTNSGAWHQWPEHQQADARADFLAGWNAALESIQK